MKKIYRFMIAALAAMAAVTACQQESPDPDTNVGDTVQVRAVIGEQTKGFTDLDGIKWEVGDMIKYSGGVDLVSDALKAEDISEDGYSATFTFPSSLNQENRTGWFVSTKCHASNYNEVEFTLGQADGSVCVQDVAGEMNSRYLFLHSGTGLVNVVEEQTPEITMDIVGTVFRVIPYTTKYNDESVLSVRMVSNTDMVGTVAYDRGAGTYRGVADVNWQTSKSVSVSLGTSFSMEGVVSAETSKGIYLAVAATKADAPLDGYQYVIETDKATYTFDAMDKTLAVEENVVKNVPLNLDNATRLVDQVKTLGFFGGVGDSTVSGDGVDALDLGYCVITVNGTYAESWGDNQNNEQLLYGNVVIECRDGAANGSILDWITVEYGKDANGKFNSTHLLATASANNTGEQRKALVCCTYNAPEGYQFEGGAQSAFRQFFVTQSPAGALKVIEFWGAIAADYTHDYTAATAWGLGYWVVNVDGSTATDWSGDSKNEQAIYGGAQFKCYDYTDGVRGTEVDWVTVGYKQQDGKVIDTWWCADLQENTTGAVRKAEIVCTFPELDGYTYKDGQNVRTTVIIQNPDDSSSDGEQSGEGETGGDAEGEYSYEIICVCGWTDASPVGFPVSFGAGHYFTIQNVKKGGTPVTITSEIAAELIDMAFKFKDEKPETGYDNRAYATREQIYIGILSNDGSVLMLHPCTSADSANTITRMEWYASDGTMAGYIYPFV